MSHMDVSTALLFFFSALGAFNGFIMGIYFLAYARPKHISHKFLGLLLLMLSFRIGKSVFFYFNPDLSLHFLQAGLTACFFIGPSLYFYLKSITNPNKDPIKLWWIHLSILIPTIVLVGVIWPFNTYPEAWRDYIICGIYYQWLAYIIASGFLLKKVYKGFLAHENKMHSVEFWVLSVFIGNGIIWFAYNSSYTSYITGALSFSFIFYLLILLLFNSKKKNSILFINNPKYADKKIETSEASVMTIKLIALITENQLHRNPNLKLPDVAKKMHILPHKLSQLLNDNLKKTFPQFINEYRIEDAKQLIKNNPALTLEAIGYECGFNSKSTFYATFKKLTGTTPAKYQSQFN